MARLATLALAAAFIVPPLAHAQAQVPQQNIPAAVSGLAPQLVNFAGSTANFQNLVNGLAQGTPVTLVALTADGFQQTATFTPTSALTPVQIAQTLEQARQSLIARGVAAPTPEQIGVSLLGGNLTTPSGTSTVAALLPSAPAGSASTGASAPAASNLQVTVRPVNAIPQASTGASATAPVGAVQAPTQTSDSPRVRNTSDTPFAGNTSDTPLPPTNVPSASAPGGVTNTSPAAQMQGRR